MDHDSELRRELAALRTQLSELDETLQAIENSRFFRLLRWPGRFWRAWKGRLGQALLYSPLHPVYLKIVRPRPPHDLYPLWLEQQHETPSISELRYKPFISIVMPVHNPRREWLEAAMESVFRQSYRCWELCVCDDASSDPWVREYLAQAAAAEPRVRFVRSDQNLGIAGASNLAGTLARGEYVGFLDQDDLLAPHALHCIAEALQDGPADLLYSDEDRLDSTGQRAAPLFKPDWSPDLLLSCMYFGHFLVVRRAALDRAGWLRSAFDGSQDYDLALRVTEAGGPVRHVPRILYHWRQHAGSTSSNAAAKPYTHAAGMRALTEALDRRKCPARVEDGPVPNTYRVRRNVSGSTRVSIVICSRTAPLLKRCLRAIQTNTSYANREIVVVQHRTGDDNAMDRLLQRASCVRVPYAGAFNFSVMNNLGARHASGEVLVFLNDDAVPLTPEWLTALVAHAVREEMGVVGARLLYPSGAIQHAGLALGVRNGVGHPHRNTYGSGYWHWWNLTRNVSAVTGACLAVRKTVFEELGGFDPAFPVNYNDADLCLRAREAGYEVIYEPAVMLRHYECQTRRPGIRYEERARWEQRWGGKRDPFYSPHLTNRLEDASLRFDDYNN